MPIRVYLNERDRHLARPNLRKDETPYLWWPENFSLLVPSVLALEKGTTWAILESFPRNQGFVLTPGIYRTEEYFLLVTRKIRGDGAVDFHVEGKANSWQDLQEAMKQLLQNTLTPIPDTCIKDTPLPQEEVA